MFLISPVFYVTIHCIHCAQHPNSLFATHTHIHTYTYIYIYIHLFSYTFSHVYFHFYFYFLTVFITNSISFALLTQFHLHTPYTSFTLIYHLPLLLSDLYWSQHFIHFFHIIIIFLATHSFTSHAAISTALSRLYFIL